MLQSAGLGQGIKKSSAEYQSLHSLFCCAFMKSYSYYVLGPTRLVLLSVLQLLHVLASHPLSPLGKSQTARTLFPSLKAGLMIARTTICKTNTLTITTKHDKNKKKQKKTQSILKIIFKYLYSARQKDEQRTQRHKKKHFSLV